MTNYLNDDGQGSVTQSPHKGKIADSYDYDPFGEVEGGVEDNDIIFDYNGEEYIHLIGLEFLRSRYYSPQTGTFTSQDEYKGDLEL